MSKTAIVDYGAGNLLSVAKALEYVGISAVITGDPQELERADGVLLPGVGAFPDAMASLESRGLVPVLQRQAGKKPFLGICLGMQLLFSLGLEMGETPGLGLLEGRVERIVTPLKLPQIGWNSLELTAPCPLTAGLPAEPYVYFVHSFAAAAGCRQDVAAVTRYGTEVTAMVARGSLFGCQFHPEKSGDVGLAILKNFGALLP